MSTNAVVCGIGPLSPPITGPGIKNRHLKTGLEDRGVEIYWVNTLNFRPRTIMDIVQSTGKYDYFILSASSKIRLAVGLLLSIDIRMSHSRAILLPMGGQFVQELHGLPTGIRQLYIRVFEEFDGIFPETQSLTREIDREINGQTVVEMVPNFRPRPNRPPSRINDSWKPPLRLVYVGRIKETKGLNDILRAISIVQTNKKNIELDIYGHFLPGDPYETRFRELCASTTGAKFHGEIPDGCVIETLKDFDVFVFPSIYPGEGFPGVFVEAFMAGCPIIATDWNFNGELIDVGQNGFLFQPGKYDELADLIEFIYHHPAKLREMKMNAWETSKNYSVDTTIKQLLSYMDAFGWSVVPQSE